MFTVTYIKNNYLMEQKLAIINFKNVSPKYQSPSFSLPALDHRDWFFERGVWEKTSGQSQV